MEKMCNAYVASMCLNILHLDTCTFSLMLDQNNLEEIQNVSVTGVTGCCFLHVNKTSVSFS